MTVPDAAGKLQPLFTDVLQNTDGTPPQAGIDWEPDWERLFNVRMINCIMKDNKVLGIDIFLYRPAWRGPADISISHRYCYSEGLNRQGIAVTVNAAFDKGPKTDISFTDCVFLRSGSYHSCVIEDMSALKSKTTFTRCLFNKMGGNGEPIRLRTQRTTADGSSVTTTFGGIAFNDCIVNYDQNTPFLRFTDNANNGLGIRDLSGKINVNNPYGATIDIGSVKENITLSYSANLTKPPQVSISSPVHLAKVREGDILHIEATANDPDAGSGNGDGIERVIFRVRRGLILVDSSTVISPPFTSDITTNDWEPGIYTVWAEAISKDGATIKNLKAVAIEIVNAHETTGIKDTGSETLADEFRFGQNYPNPFSLSTEIAYHLPVNAFVRIDLFNHSGQLIRKLVNEKQTQGDYTIFLSNLGDKGTVLKSGFFFYKMTATDKGFSAFSETRKMLVVK